MAPEKGGGLRALPLLTRQLIVAAIMVLVSLTFGAYALVAHAALSGTSLSPLVFALTRDTLAVLALQAASFHLHRGGAHFWPAPEDQARFILCGLLGVWASQAGSALALASLDPVLYSLLQPLLPVATALWATLAGQEAWRAGSRASWLKALGLLTTVGGAVYVGAASAPGGGGGGGGSRSLLLGLLFAGVQILGGGAYPVAQRPLMARYPALVVCAWGYTYGWVALLLCALSSATEASSWAFTPASAGGAVFAGLLASAGCYGAMAFCVELVGPLFMVRGGRASTRAHAHARATPRFFPSPTHTPSTPPLVDRFHAAHGLPGRLAAVGHGRRGAAAGAGRGRRAVHRWAAALCVGQGAGGARGARSRGGGRGGGGGGRRAAAPRRRGRAEGGVVGARAPQQKVFSSRFAKVNNVQLQNGGDYLRGMKRELCVAPRPGRPCRVGL